jgi:hypothetical protein
MARIRTGLRHSARHLLLLRTNFERKIPAGMCLFQCAAGRKKTLGFQKSFGIFDKPDHNKKV